MCFWKRLGEFIFSLESNKEMGGGITLYAKVQLIVEDKRIVTFDTFRTEGMRDCLFFYSIGEILQHRPVILRGACSLAKTTDCNHR